MAFSLPNIVIKPQLVALFHGDSPPLCSVALRLRNTKVPVWAHESIGYAKMDISHWDAAIHNGIQLAQYCDQTRSFNASLRRLPPVYSLTLRLSDTPLPPPPPPPPPCVRKQEVFCWPVSNKFRWSRGQSNLTLVHRNFIIPVLLLPVQLLGYIPLIYIYWVHYLSCIKFHDLYAPQHRS